MVLGDMSGASSEFKVLKPVVMFDAVDVVDIIVESERPSKMLLHDEAMLKDVKTTSGKLDVSVSPYFSRNAFIAAAARTEPHVASFRSARLNGKLHGAGRADEANRHSSPPKA